jgi:hypothetical protein
MSETHELLLGYDVRVGSTTGSSGWHAERRRRFLLREDADPCSVDTAVWPRPSSLGHDSRGLFVFDPDDARRLRSGSSVVIAITVVPRIGVTPPVPFHALSAPADWARWTRIGYDVADFVLLSGLSNCGWADKPHWVAMWHDALNDKHLVSDASSALALAQATDARVVEHAPFFAYGVYADSRGEMSSGRPNARES